jgi:hypothetical protein
MEGQYRDQRVIPNEALRKLLEKPLESKIRTDGLRSDVVVDLELSKEDTASDIVQAVDSDEKALQSWKDLKKKLLDDSGTSGAVSEAGSCFAEISSSAARVSGTLESISRKVLAPEIGEAGSEKVTAEKLTDNDVLKDSLFDDPFYTKLMILLSGVLALGLLTGILAGLIVAKVF